jgi:hypothetical protein
MARKPSPPAPRPADWTPTQAHVALGKQLAALDSLRDRSYREIEHQEQEWMNLTLNILTHGFGENSNNVKQFHQAKWAGEHHTNMNEREIQRNFTERIQAFAALRSSLAELELMGAGIEQTPAERMVLVQLRNRKRLRGLTHELTR